MDRTIIGGADGPTAIYLAASGEGGLLAACGLLLALAAGVCLYRRSRKRRK